MGEDPENRGGQLAKADPLLPHTQNSCRVQRGPGKLAQFRSKKDLNLPRPLFISLPNQPPVSLPKPLPSSRQRSTMTSLCKVGLGQLMAGPGTEMLGQS